jgi:hypothetical protein
MKNKRNISALVLALALILAICAACTQKPAPPTPSPSAAETSALPSETPEVTAPETDRELMGLMAGALTSDGAYTVMVGLGLADAFERAPAAFVLALATYFSPDDQTHIIEVFISVAVAEVSPEESARLREQLTSLKDTMGEQYHAQIDQMSELYDKYATQNPPLQ